MNSLEITEKRNITLQKMQDIVNKCKRELREMTEEEQAEFNASKAEVEMLKDELAKLKEKLAGYENEVSETEQVKQEEIIEENKRNKQNKTMKEFRLLNAINSIVNNKPLTEEERSFIAKGEKEMRDSGMSYAGQIQLPVSETRATIAVGSEKSTVDVNTENILEALRGRNILVAAGAKFMTGLVGDVQVPCLNGAQVNWEGETDTTADGNASMTSVKLQAKRLSCYVDVTKQFLMQTSEDAEAVLRQDLINAVNQKLESTIFGTGTGSTTEPSGLFNTTASPTLVEDFADLCDLEATIDGSNVLNETKYILANNVKAKFRCTPKVVSSTTGTSATATVASGAIYEKGEIDGVEALNSSNVTANYFAFGDFSNLAIGQWGAIDIIVDPYTKAADGMVRLVVNAYFDIKVLRSGAIAVGKIA